MGDETGNGSNDDTSDDEHTRVNITPDFTPEDRPRGILSQVDREYLCGLKEYAHAQTEANRKQDIRERIINGLKDFGLLWYSLESDELSTIFNELGEESVDLCIEAMVAFAYRGLNQDRPRLEERIERGVLRGANLDKSGRRVGAAMTADVSINIDYGPDVDNLYKQVQEGKADQLTASEIGALVQAGKLEANDLEQLEDTGSEFPKIIDEEGTDERVANSEDATE